MRLLSYPLGGMVLIQFPFEGVIENVILDVFQIFIISDDVVVEGALPEWGVGRIGEVVDDNRCVGFVGTY